MLILSRREAECICLGDDIVITIVAVGNDKVRIGVKAPPGVRILREELEVELKESALPSRPYRIVAAEQPETKPQSFSSGRGIPVPARRAA